MRRSKRIAEKKSKTIKIPTREQIFEDIPSTSKMNVRVQMPFKQNTRNFSRETHRYNQETIDDNFGDELSSSQENFIANNNSPSIHESVGSLEDKDYSSGISSQSSSNDSSIVEGNFDDNQYDIELLSQENVRKSQSTPQRQFDSSQESEILHPPKAKSKKRCRVYSDDDDEKGESSSATCSKNVKKRLFRRPKTPDVEDNIFAEKEKDWYSDGNSFSEKEDDEEDESLARSSRILAAKLRKRNDYFEKYVPLIEERKQREARKLTKKKDENSQNKIDEYDSSTGGEDDRKQNIQPLYHNTSRYYQKLEILFKKLTNGKLKSEDPNFVKVKGRFYDRPRFVAGEIEIFDNNDIDFSDYDF